MSKIDDNVDRIFKEVITMAPGRKIACLIVSGSLLYGSENKDSDIDIKGVYLPTEREVYLGEHKKSISYSSGDMGSKNSKDDIDIELYSLHHFFSMLKKSESGAISMINSPRKNILSENSVWEMIVNSSGLFYSKEMTGVLGYARKQASKYSIKGERLASAQYAYDFLCQYDHSIKIGEIWSILPKDDFLYTVEKDGISFWSVCERLIQSTNTIKYSKDIIKTIVDGYGHRAKKARDNSGLDWKAISHAYRVAYELIDIYTKGKINYPLVEAEKIKLVKSGILNFKEDVANEITELIDYVEKLGRECEMLPDVINFEKVDDLLINVLKSI